MVTRGISALASHRRVTISQKGSLTWSRAAPGRDQGGQIVRGPGSRGGPGPTSRKAGPGRAAGASTGRPPSRCAGCPAGSSDRPPAPPDRRIHPGSESKRATASGLQYRFAVVVELIFVLLDLAGAEEQVDDFAVLSRGGDTLRRQVREDRVGVSRANPGAGWNARSASGPPPWPGRSRWAIIRRCQQFPQPGGHVVVANDDLRMLAEQGPQVALDHVGGQLQIEPRGQGRVGLRRVDDLVVGDPPGRVSTSAACSSSARSAPCRGGVGSSPKTRGGGNSGRERHQTRGTAHRTKPSLPANGAPVAWHLETHAEAFAGHEFAHGLPDGLLRLGAWTRRLVPMEAAPPRLRRRPPGMRSMFAEVLGTPASARLCPPCPE